MEVSKCLVVGPSLAHAERVCRAMEPSSVETCVMSCEDVEGAKALLSTEKFDRAVVFSDLKADLGGERVLRYLAAHYPNIKCAFLGAPLPKSLEILDVQSHLLGNWQALKIFAEDQNGLPGMLRHQHFGPHEKFLAEALIETYAQPVMKLAEKSWETMGFECLVRAQGAYADWNPEFIFAHAAKKDLLYETDTLCIEKAVKQLTPAICEKEIFINLRPRTLANSRIISFLKTLFRDNDLKFSQVVFELTEQQKILNHSEFLKGYHHLRELGAKVALDDFGTGFANLQLIHVLRPDFIKMSGAFGLNVERSKSKQIIIESVVGLGQKFGIPVVVESIENEDALATVEALGVKYAQGFYFGRPKPFAGYF